MRSILSSLVPSRKIDRQRLAHLVVFLGYTIESFAIYGTGDLRTADYLQNYLDGNPLEHLSGDWNVLLQNRVLVGISVAMAFALAVSSQINYSEMVVDLYAKILQLQESNLTEEELLQNKEKLKAYLTKVCNIIATQTKVFVSTGSLLDIILLFTSNPSIALGLSAALNVFFGQLAQFAVLGKNYDIKVFFKALISSIETLAISSVLYPILRVAFAVPQAGLKTYYVFRALTIIESASVTFANHALLRSDHLLEVIYTRKSKSKILESRDDFSEEGSMRSMVSLDGNKRNWWPGSNTEQAAFVDNDQLARFFSNVAVFLGYTIENFATYGSGDLRFSYFIKDCLNGTCPDGLPSDWKVLLSDPAIVAVCVAAGLCLAIANQVAYTELSVNLFKKINPLYQAYQRETKNGPNKKSLYYFLKQAIDIIATHTKVFVAMGALFDLVNLIMGNPSFTLALTGVISLVFSELAQFAVLGKNYDINVFFTVLGAAVESLGLSACLYTALRYLFDFSNIGLKIFVASRVLTFVESAFVSFTGTSMLGFGFQTVKGWIKPTAAVNQIESQPLLQEDSESEASDDEGPQITQQQRENNKQRWVAALWERCCGGSNDNADAPEPHYSHLVNTIN